MESILEVRDLSVRYDISPILHDVNLRVREGRIMAIIGPSGCGKSTLLRTMNRTIEEDGDARWSGTILLEGQDTRRMDVGDLRTRVGLVFQTPTPFPFSIWKNMTYGLRYRGMRDKAELNDHVKRALRMAGLYDEVEDRMKSNALKLSGGQQQRLCIARALTMEPKVLLLDEPCSALDAKSSAAIEETLATIKERVAIVLVTHNIAQARRLADDLVFMSEGEVVESGPAERLFENAGNQRTRDYLFTDDLNDKRR